jgi:hypothetical protein
MVVDEKVTLSDMDGKTLFTQQAQVEALGAFQSVGKVIEDLAVKRFKANASRGRQALEHVTERFWQEASSLEAKIGQTMDDLSNVWDSMQSFSSPDSKASQASRLE